jgi:hypothetical protein
MVDHAQPLWPSRTYDELSVGARLATLMATQASPLAHPAPKMTLISHNRSQRRDLRVSVEVQAGAGAHGPNMAPSIRLLRPG